MHDVHLLKAGRHFRVRGIRAIVAKSEAENRRLEALCRGRTAVYVSDSHPGPSIALFGGTVADRLDLLSRLLSRYSKAGVPGPYVVREISPDGERTLSVPENRDFREVELGLLC
jgi:hypothetical protein